MSVSVTFNGNTYLIPQEGEIGWDSLTDYLVSLSSAALSTLMKHSATNVTSSTYTAQASDTVIYVNYAGAVTVNLPAGTTDNIGQFYFIFDSSGSASTNNITIDPNSTQTIQGHNTFVINQNYAGIITQWNGVEWKIVGEFKDNTLRTPEALNKCFLDCSIQPTTTPPSVADGLSCSALFSGSKSILVEVAVGNYSMLIQTDYASNTISALSDIGELFLASDAGTGVYIYKSAASGTVHFKNRMGTSAIIEIKALTNTLSSVTAWS